MGATATSVSCVVSCLESALSHTLSLGSTLFQLVWISTIQAFSDPRTLNRGSPFNIEQAIHALALTPLSHPDMTVLQTDVYPGHQQTTVQCVTHKSVLLT